MGDALSLSESGLKLVCFPVSDSGDLGQGFSESVIKRFPIYRELYEMAKRKTELISGNNVYIKPQDDVVLVSMVCQRGKRTRQNYSNLDLTSLKECMIKVVQQFKDRNPTIICPDFANFRATGIKHDGVQKLILAEWVEKGIIVNIYRRV